MSDVTKLLLEKYNSKTAERLNNVGNSGDDLQLWSYRKAAALLHCFIPDQLKPLQEKYVHKSPFTLLSEDIIPLSGGFADGLYTMKPDFRNSVLKQFSGIDEMRIGLKANPDRIETPLQEMWENYLSSGKLPAADKIAYRELLNLHQIATWLVGIEKKIPKLDTLLELIKRKSVLANFEHLVISNFTGREHELSLFRRHISDGGPTAKPILAIHGPGGIGKSALIGRILYERAIATEKDRLPYVYLAFDQPSLRIDRPATIFLEAANQLELQYPLLRDYFENFRELVREFGTTKKYQGSRSITYGGRSERGMANASLNVELYVEFANLLKKISEKTSSMFNKNKNVLITFDTFEEVQYRDRESLFPFYKMLSFIIERIPQLRILMAGRSSIRASFNDNGLINEMPLDELQMEDRISLLQRLDINDKNLAELVARRIGGNPLSLRLAAQVVFSEQDAGRLNDIIPEKWLLFKMDEQLIQGYLYKRILNHIHDENVRKLAHPGMVLRKVTPQIILEVLAPVCEITVESFDESKKLFEELEKEHALVQLGEFETLKYRPDIRLTMVKLLQQDKFEEVRLLHEKAIEYYSKKDTEEDRAEELYHRLALGNDDPYELNYRWLYGIEQSVASSLDEYPDRMKAWLASKMSLEVSREVFQNASVIEWERNITRKVKRAMLNMEIEHALFLLHERNERSISSPLYALEAKAYLILSNFKDANKVLENGINNVSQSTNRGRLAELLWLKSQVELTNKNALQADELLLQAQESVQQAKDPLTFIHIVCQRLLLQKTFKVFPNEHEDQLRGHLNTACLKLNKNRKGVPEFIIALAVGFLKGYYPKSENRLIEYYPTYFKINSTTTDEWNMLISENLRGLEKYREEWEDDDDNQPDSNLNAEFESFV